MQLITIIEGQHSMLGIADDFGLNIVHLYEASKEFYCIMVYAGNRLLEYFTEITLVRMYYH